MKVADCGKMPWIPSFLQELSCRGLMPSSKEAAGMSLCVCGAISRYESTTADKATDKASRHTKSHL